MSYVTYASKDVAESASRPILSTIYSAAGWICLCVAGVAIVAAFRGPSKLLLGSIWMGSAALFSALVCFGVAQVFTLIARIEFNSRKSEENLRDAVGYLRQIAKSNIPEARVDRA